MKNFVYWNPTRIVFGAGSIAQLKRLVPAGVKILLLYGGGSIFKNGVHAQVLEALQGWQLIEFGGIEPNPTYETLMQAVEIIRKENIDFLLAVGGGSVLDGTKFIAAAVPYGEVDPWDILANGARVSAAIPFGSVLTLPATGSEMNSGAVISRKSTQEKRNFSSPFTFPLFSILDPTSTFSLPAKQVRNGIVDTFVHVVEQYLTFPQATPLQDRQAEAILLTLVEQAEAILAEPKEYDAMATFMWSATQALNGVIGCGLVQDWATHTIGHELTAFYGLDHAETLAVIYPALLRHKHESKREKLLQYGERIFGINQGSQVERVEAAIAATEQFFHKIGMPTTLGDYQINPQQAAERIAERMKARNNKIGEHDDILPEDVHQIVLDAG
ncbi:MAG: NADH-dependent alcohol dehydrogenase [Chloroflexi bacterium 44-23]|nr:MAG: NADH-dependent alcohol dehydrogenase [Chloroflexi bacterium 44-23]